MGQEQGTRAGRGPGGLAGAAVVHEGTRCSLGTASSLSDPAPREVRSGSRHSTEEWDGQESAGAGAQSIAKGRSQREGHGGGAAHSHALKKLLVLLISPATLHLAVQLAQDLILKLQRYRRERVRGTEDVLSSAPGCHDRSSAGHKAAGAGRGWLRGWSQLGPRKQPWAELLQVALPGLPSPVPLPSSHWPPVAPQVLLLPHCHLPAAWAAPAAWGIPALWEGTVSWGSLDSAPCPLKPLPALLGGQGSACLGPPPPS